MSRLLDALRRKFRKPEDVIAALGLDASLIAMDSAIPGRGRVVIGDSFAEVEGKAAKEYGSEEAGKRVAAAVGFKKYGKAGMERKAQAGKDAAFEEGQHPRDESGKFAGHAAAGPAHGNTPGGGPTAAAAAAKEGRRMGMGKRELAAHMAGAEKGMSAEGHTRMHNMMGEHGFSHVGGGQYVHHTGAGNGSAHISASGEHHIHVPKGSGGFSFGHGPGELQKSLQSHKNFLAKNGSYGPEGQAAWAGQNRMLPKGSVGRPTGDAETAHDPSTGRFTSGTSAGTVSAMAEHGYKPAVAYPHRDMPNSAKGTTTFQHRRGHRVNVYEHNDGGTSWHHIAAAGNTTARGASTQALHEHLNQLHKNFDRNPPRLAGDSKERSMTTKVKFSPTALVAMGALTHYIEPRLAQDSALDLKPILRGLTAANFKARRPLITSQIRAAVTGNLAADADIEDLGEVLDRIDQLADEGREALGEARADEGEDAPEDQTEGLGSGEMEGAGEEGGGEDDANEIREFLSDKLSPEDLETVCAMMKAKGEDEDPDEKEEEKKEPAMDRKAMDAAIRTSVAAAIRANDKKHADIAAARAEVRPYVGELTIGCDSAEAVYRHALTAMGVDVKDVHRDALAPILRAQPRPGGGTRPAEARIAHDAAGAKSFNDMFPGAARIGTA